MTVVNIYITIISIEPGITNIAMIAIAQSICHLGYPESIILQNPTAMKKYRTERRAILIYHTINLSMQ
jgi:hypothetical protein